MNLKKIVFDNYKEVDRIYRTLDRKKIRRTKNIRLIPDIDYRIGGKVSYAEWAHVIGIFQTLIYQSVSKKLGNNILDIGCGTGLIGIASESFTFNGGSYTGIDVSKADIDFSKSQYPHQNYKFIHLDTYNATYANKQSPTITPWPVDSNSIDLVTALSVWTHFKEEDAFFYLKEVDRTLQKGGKAIITLFLLDQFYQEAMLKMNAKSRFHFTDRTRFIFDQSAYGSEHWFCPSWVAHPEDAIGLTSIGFERLLSAVNLKLVAYHPGCWKELPGIYMQDIIILEKV